MDKIIEEVEEKEYLVGTKPNCPIQNVSVGGICFPLYNEDVTVDDAGQTHRSRINGAIVKMDKNKYEFVKAKIKSKVIRWRDKNKKIGYIVNIEKNKTLPNDEPLENYIYIEDIRKLAMKDPQWRENILK